MPTMTRTANIGAADKKIRVAAGILMLAMLLVVHGGARWLCLLGLVPLATVYMNWCPLYSMLETDTLEK
jgi:hypothetical protein